MVIKFYHAVSPKKSNLDAHRFNGHIGEAKFFHYEFSRHPSIELVEKVEDCDFIIYVNKVRNHFPLEEIPDKGGKPFIIIDYTDPYTLDNYPSDKPPFLFFKRSLCPMQRCGYFGRRSVQKYPLPVIPLSYAARYDVLDATNDLPPHSKRKIDVRCFFSGKEPKGRGILVKLIKKIAKKNKVACVCGKVFDNKVTEKLRRHDLNMAYIRDMLDSKIIVTCNPERQEGDYRLFEAMCSGALVMVDEMNFPKENSFENGVHLIYYNDSNFEKLLCYYLSHPEKAQEIASCGVAHTKAYHTWRHRVDKIVRHITSSK